MGEPVKLKRKTDRLYHRIWALRFANGTVLNISKCKINKRGRFVYWWRFTDVIRKADRSDFMAWLNVFAEELLRDHGIILNKREFVDEVTPCWQLTSEDEAESLQIEYPFNK